MAPVAASAQPLKLKKGPGGTVSIGVRSSTSLFNDGHAGAPGLGVGGQMRVRVSDRVNTNWFYDYLSGSAGDKVYRADQHIGWSVLFYVLKAREERRLFQPYVLAGHCFDRWDASLVSQYMVHLGTDVHAEEHGDEVHFYKEKGAGLEGHLLVHLSFNYKLFDAW